VILDLVLEEPDRIQGVIVSNPALDAEGVASWRVLVARVLSRLWPGFSLDTGIPLEASCRDPERLAAYAADPLRHGRCSARLGAAFLDVAARIRRDAPQLQLPILVLQSGKDTITPPESTRRFFAGLTASDRTLKLYPESLHELFDDLDRRVVLDDLLGWLDAHAP
jgi:alpha-beta hydrolase superfamily lysophospholipase